MWVLSTHFDNQPYSLPNLERVANSFADFVTRYEKKALVDLLGYDFYKRLIDGLAEETPDQIWIEIRDGAEYTTDSEAFRYEGLVDLLRPYIYSEWIRAGFEKYSGIGAVIPSAENAIVVSPKRHVVLGWNDYITKLGFINKSTSTRYHEDLEDYYFDYYGELVSVRNTLFGLLQSSTDYGKYEYNSLDPINIFDL